MNQRYLEVTYRRGRPIAAYLYLPRQTNDRSARSEPRPNGLVVDYAADGRAIGIEVTSPATVSIADLNEILAELHQAPATPGEVAPLSAA
jgi:hypothetical protein